MIASIAAPRVKLLVLSCESRDLMSALYCCKCADVVVLIVNAVGGQEGLYDDVGSTFLTALKAQGMPSVVGLVQGLDGLSHKKAADMLKYANRFYESEFGEDIKVATPSSPHQLVRHIANAKLRSMAWRAQRPFVVAHAAQFDLTSADTGTLVISGESVLFCIRFTVL